MNIATRRVETFEKLVLGDGVAVTVNAAQFATFGDNIRTDGGNPASITVQESQAVAHIGSNGDDSFTSIAGVSTLLGGDGSDTLDLSGISGAVDLTATQFIGMERLVLADGGVAVLSSAQVASFAEITATGNAGARIQLSDMSALYEIGGDLRDVFIGSDADDLLYGGGGDDIIYGEAGEDLISGGDGIDRLFGEDGADTLHGGAGMIFFLGPRVMTLIWRCGGGYPVWDGWR